MNSIFNRSVPIIITIITITIITKRQPRRGSSHFTYTLNELIITIPYNRPYVKRRYIVEAIDLLEKLDY